jgi:hypothetical protein
MIDTFSSKLFGFGPTRRLLERVLPKPGMTSLIGFGPLVDHLRLNEYIKGTPGMLCLTSLFSTRFSKQTGTNPSREMCESGYFWEYVVAEAATGKQFLSVW